MITTKRLEIKHPMTVMQSTFINISSAEDGAAIYSDLDATIRIAWCVFQNCSSNNRGTVTVNPLVLKCSTFKNCKAKLIHAIYIRNDTKIDFIEITSGQSDAHAFYISGNSCQFMSSNISRCQSGWNTFGRIDSNLVSRNFKFADNNHSSFSFEFYSNNKDIKYMNVVNFWTTGSIFIYVARNSQVYFSDSLFVLGNCQKFLHIYEKYGNEYTEIRNSILVFNYPVDSNVKLFNVTKLNSAENHYKNPVFLSYHRNYCPIQSYIDAYANHFVIKPAVHMYLACLIDI